MRTLMRPAREPEGNARLVALFLVAALPVLGADARAHSLATQFERVSPAVVEIATREEVMRGANGARPYAILSRGSGVIVSPGGRVVTAAHLVQSADRIDVTFHDGHQTTAQVVAAEPAADIALLQVAEVPASARAVKLGDAGKVRVGDETFVVAAPYGMRYTMSAGRISGRHRLNLILGDLMFGEVLQSDAVVNQGASGGPMFNLGGEVIGIVSRTLGRDGGFEGIGFAVTSDTVRRLLFEQPSFWLGVNGYWLSGPMAHVLNLPQPCGILVQGVASGSPAARLGLRAGTVEARIGDEALILGGDVILEIQGLCLHDEPSYRIVRERMSKLAFGDVITVKVLRSGKVEELSTTVLRSVEQAGPP